MHIEDEGLTERSKTMYTIDNFLTDTPDDPANENPPHKKKIDKDEEPRLHQKVGTAKSPKTDKRLTVASDLDAREYGFRPEFGDTTRKFTSMWAGNLVPVSVEKHRFDVTKFNTRQIRSSMCRPILINDICSGTRSIICRGRNCPGLHGGLGLDNLISSKE